MTILMVFACAFAQAQTVERTVLIESFTNASCPPCAAQNPGFNVLLGNNYDKLAVIKYQTDWPGYDPMNQQNPSEVQTRVSYYGVSGVPNVRIDGATNVGTSGQTTQSMINTAYAVPAELEINLWHSLADDLSTITIHCDIINPDTMTEWSVPDTYLRLAIVEKSLNFPAPPGSTNQTLFKWVMRKMLPNANGTAMPSIPAGDTINFTWEVPLPTYIYNYTQIGVVAFVQAHAARTVYQAAVSEPLPIDYPDAGVISVTDGPSGLCDYDLTPGAIVSNEYDVEINSFDISYTLNGGAPVTQSWAGSLLAGNSVDVVFPSIVINAGQTVLQYSVSNINGGVNDVNSLNDLTPTETFSALSPEPIGTELLAGFEPDPTGNVPSNTIVQKAVIRDLIVVNQSWFAANVPSAPANDPVGGYANSSKSILWGLWWTTPGLTTTMTFEKLDWTENINDSLTFDIAYRQYSNENDRLRVQISTDCGITWTTVYDKAGATLSTVGPGTTFFVPTAAQWRTEAIDLSSFDGNEVVVRFSVLADFGNNLFLDNINLFGESIVAVEDVILEGNVNVFPNPASDMVNVNFTMSKTSRVSVLVYDLAGRQVATLLDDQILQAGGQNIQWDNPAGTGLYFVKIRTEEGEVTKKVTVLK